MASPQKVSLLSRQSRYHGVAEDRKDRHVAIRKVMLTTTLILTCALATTAFHNIVPVATWSQTARHSMRSLPRTPSNLRMKPAQALRLDSSVAEASTEGKFFVPQFPEQAYDEVEKIMAHYAKTFYLGSKFFPLEKRKAIWAVYVWCRRTDEIVDGPDVSKDPVKLLADLKAWEERLDLLFEGKPLDASDYVLAESLKVFPGKKDPYYDMIEGMRMDLPVVGKNRYETWDELYLYCYRVASTVGIMTLPVMGIAEGYTYEQAEPPAVALGIALQITNILRDVGEDYRDRGRIYLPREDMVKFGVTEEQIKEGIVDDNYRQLMKFEIQRARDYYALAQSGILMLAPEARMPVQSSLDLYSKILDSIENNDFDNFSKRAFVTTWTKLATLPISWLRTWGLRI